MRLLPVVVLTLGLAFGTSACQANQDNTSNTASSDTSQPTTTTPSSKTNHIEITTTLSGTWKAPGDLCKIIDGATAADIMGYDGTLTADSKTTNMAAANGVDACYYRDPAANTGMGTIVSVQKLTDKQWQDTLAEVEAEGEFTKFTSDHFDEAVVTKNNQALVRQGEFMGSALNSSLGKFDATALVKLTAQALLVVG